MFYYINSFAADCWRQGTIPLWNPYIMLGQPFLGEGQAALFHPLSWLFIALPAGAAFNWLMALSFLFAGLAFYGYLRSLSLSRDTASCGALVWCFSSIMISRIYAGHLTNLLIFFELPLMLMLWERHRQTGSLRPLLGLSVVYALMILAAHPQFLYIFSLFFLCYVLIQSALSATQGRAAALAESKAILRLGCFVLLGVGIGAVQLLPTTDFARESFRAQASLKFAGSFSFPPENLLSLFVPCFFGSFVKQSPEFDYGQYWGRGNFWEMWAYIGALPLILAVPGFFAAPRRWRIPLIACALIFTLFALGSYTPIFPLLFKFVPGLSFFRGPSKSIHVTTFCLAAFSAYGLEALLHPKGGENDRRSLKASLITAAVGLLIIAIAFVYLIPGDWTPHSHFIQLFAWAQKITPDRVAADAIAHAVHWSTLELLRAAFSLILAAATVTLFWSPRWSSLWPKARLPLILAVILADLLLVFFPLFVTFEESITALPPEMAAACKFYKYPPRMLAPQFDDNKAMRYHFSSPSGYVGATLARYNTYLNTLLDLPPDQPQVDAPLTMYGPQLRFFAFDAELKPRRHVTPWMPVLAQGDGYAMTRFHAPYPRAYLAAAPRRCASPQDALYYVISYKDRLYRNPAVEQGETALPPAGDLSADEQATITAFAPNRIELCAKANQPRVLVLAEAYEKNWKATVNGVSAPIFPANYLFRGVVVPAGGSRVVFTYQPAAFRWGAAISLLSLVAAAMFGAWHHISSHSLESLTASSYRRTCRARIAR